jgi:hypothetical protein
MNGPQRRFCGNQQGLNFVTLSASAGIFMPAEPGLGNRISEVLGWTYFFAWCLGSMLGADP